MLDLISRELRVMRLFIFFLFLLLSWALLGMVMNMVGSGLRPLRMMTGPVQHFRSAFWMLGDMVFLPSDLSGRAFWELSMLF